MAKKTKKETTHPPRKGVDIVTCVCWDGRIRWAADPRLDGDDFLGPRGGQRRVPYRVAYGFQPLMNLEPSCLSPDRVSAFNAWLRIDPRDAAHHEMNRLLYGLPVVP